jgi:hypothetical protein
MKRLRLAPLNLAPSHIFLFQGLSFRSNGKLWLCFKHGKSRETCFAAANDIFRIIRPLMRFDVRYPPNKTNDEVPVIFSSS